MLTGGKNRKATMATMLGGSYSLLLVYFVAEVQRHLQAQQPTASPAGRAVLCGRTRFLCRFRVDGILF